MPPNEDGLVRRPFSWMNPKLETGATGKYGEGIFARSPIRKHELLIAMGGYIITTLEDNQLNGSIADKPIEISEELLIGPLRDADLPLTPQCFVNHSCAPNAGFRGQIFLTAMRNIAAYEEITYDYAMIQHTSESSNSYFRMTCQCGSNQCRGVTTEDDWKIPELQLRYDGYFQYYLQEKINRIALGDDSSMGTPPPSHPLPAPWEKGSQEDNQEVLNDERPFSWMNPKLVMKERPFRGRGVFAAETVEKDELCAVFGGYVMEAALAADLPRSILDRGLQVSENLLLCQRLSADDPDEISFNHSCNPNTGFKGQIFLVAMRTIEADEELTFDHAMCRHPIPGAPEFKMHCDCCDELCRGIVTDSDWTDRCLQSRYDGYFQSYLQEKIDEMKQAS